MKKLAIVTTIPPVNTSLSEYGKFLVNGLLTISKDVDIHVLADVSEKHQFIEEMDHDNLNVSRCWKFNSALNPFRIFNKLRKIKPDLVIFNLQFASFGNKKIPAMMGLTMPMIARILGFKVITILHNMVETVDLKASYFSSNRLERFMIEAGGNIATRMLLKSNRMVVTLDKYKNILNEKYKADNVEVIGLGSYIEPAKEIKVIEKNTFLTFGKFGTYKRLEFLLDAFGEVSKEHPDMELIIGGDDHPNRKGYLDMIQEKYKHLKNVKFIGWISDESLPEIISNCKALVLSYESTTGSSGPLHLGISQGKPVIAPYIGDFINVAMNEKVEILFYSPKDKDNLKKMFLELVDKKIDIQSISKHNLGIAKENSYIKTAQKYLDLIKKVINEDPKKTNVDIRMIVQ